jgi:glycosyltransferase involved in cell wall biosynthesis
LAWLGLAETVIDGVTGIKVEVNSVESICSAMIRLAENPGLRETYGSAARARVVKELNINIYERSIENILLDY